MTKTLEQAIIEFPDLDRDVLSEFYPTAAEVAYRKTAEYREEMRAVAERENEIQDFLLSQDA